MHNILFRVILFACICCFTSADDYVTGFRTRHSRRSALRNENFPSHPLRQSPDLVGQFGLGDFGKVLTGGQQQFTKLANDGAQQFSKVATDGAQQFSKVTNDGQQQISKGVEAVQKNMLTLWDTYSSGIKDMTERMKNVMGTLGVPKDFFDKQNEGDGDTVSKFLANEKSPPDSERDVHRRFPFSDSN